MGGILKRLIWAYLKYCQFIWLTDCSCRRQKLHIICIFGRVQGTLKINHSMWKIRCGEPWNLASWPTEFGKNCCEKLWSLL